MMGQADIQSLAKRYIIKTIAVVVFSQQILVTMIAPSASAFVTSSALMVASREPASTFLMKQDGAPWNSKDYRTVTWAQKESNLRATDTSRGEFLSRAVAGAGAAAASLAEASANPRPANALVKGNAPPAGYNKKRGSGSGNGEREPSATADALPTDEDAARTFSLTKTGVRFKDLKLGTGPEVKPSNIVDLRYRVEKLGKRSYDGISGETQSVFSLGYGDDDDKEGDILTVPLGAGRLVSAVDEAVLGMRVGGVRRVAVRPERGWKKQDPKCATEIDMGVMSGVPGAALAKVEDCIDLTLEPRPVGYGATRRMARRFDETLIVEIEMVGTKESFGRIF